MEIVSHLTGIFLMNVVPVYWLFNTQTVKRFWTLFILLAVFIFTIIIFTRSLKEIYQLQSNSFESKWKRYLKKDLSEIIDSLILATILSVMLVNTYLLCLSYGFFISIIYFIMNFLLSKTTIDFLID